MPTANHENHNKTMPGLYLSLLRVVFVLGALLGGTHPAQAGLIVINTDPGTTPSIGWDTNGDKKMDKFDEQDDTNKDGKVEILLGSQEEEKKIGSIWVLKYSDGKQIFYELNLSDSGITLASLEPFHFPTFAASDSLVASINIAALLAAGDLVNVGQSFTVNDGILTESSAITFKDGSSLFGFPQFSRDLVASLPNFNGPVNVYSLDEVLPIPEPASFWLVSVALLCLLVTQKISIFNSLIAIFWFIWSRFQEKVADPQVEPAGVSSSAPVHQLRPAPTGPASRATPLTAAEYIQVHQPRISGLPHTAPV